MSRLFPVDSFRSGKGIGEEQSVIMVDTQERGSAQGYKTSDFWYELPEELIAQTPLQQRDSSRLLVLDRESGAIAHRKLLPWPIRPQEWHWWE